MISIPVEALPAKEAGRKANLPKRIRRAVRVRLGYDPNRTCTLTFRAFGNEGPNFHKVVELLIEEAFSDNRYAYCLFCFYRMSSRNLPIRS